MSEPRSEKTFRTRCIVADEDVMFCTGDATTPDTEYEDDGYLHVRRFGVRAVFDVGCGQSLDAKEQNVNTRRIMEALGLDSKIGNVGGRVLIDETYDGEDADRCRECGAAR